MKTLLWFLLAACALAITGCGGAAQLVSTSAAPSTSNPSSTPPSQPPAPTPSPSNPSSTPSSTPPGAPAGATTLSNLQASSGWQSWGQLPPIYADCDAPCSGVTWTMTQNVSSPSLSGQAAQYDISGTMPYSDVLWTNPVIGQFSSQGLPDESHALLPTIHNFIYDADFYVTNAAVTQVLEFDVNMYMNSIGMTWGNQCDNLGDGDWDISSNSGWQSTGVPCKLIDHGWNHVTIEVQRQDDNTLLFQTITLNGKTATINQTLQPYSVPASWYGVTVNYQMDGDYQESPNTTYLDDLSLTYW